MPSSLFKTISEALRGGKVKQQPDPNISISNSNSSASTPENIEEITPPSTEFVDAMSLPSFQKVAGETDRKLGELSEVPIKLLTNHLRVIIDDEKRVKTADILLKELEGVKETYRDPGERALVGRIMSALQRFASEQVNIDIRISNLIPIHVHKAKLLPEFFENFTEAFRWKEQPIEEKKPNPSARFKPQN